MDAQIPKPFLQGLATIGLLYVASKVFSILQFLASTFVLPGYPVRISIFNNAIDANEAYKISQFGPKGSWALITGASDGIGKEFALQIAANGYNLLLVSRTASKLDALSSEIKAAHPSLKIEQVAMDFAENRDSDYKSLQRKIKDLDISVLVNNVGLSHSIPQSFADTAERDMKDIITLNDIGTLRITKLVVPGMITRKRGLILTMASFAGVMPTPLLATYSGSKAFLQAWGTALGAELAEHGILVQVVQSHLVTSNMSKIRRSSLLVPNSKAFVRATLAKIGRSGGSQGVPFTMTPYWSHAAFLYVISSTVGVWSAFVLGRNKKMHEDIRKRALRKVEREAKKGQ
jgi:17beta-estradiol 17-dehydrogenase / very-long-chain 3-oxoacyl-CoA reductase